MHRQHPSWVRVVAEGEHTFRGGHGTVPSHAAVAFVARSRAAADTRSSPASSALCRGVDSSVGHIAAADQSPCVGVTVE